MAGKKDDKPKLPVKKAKAVIETEAPQNFEEIMEQLVEVGIEPFKDPAKMTLVELEDNMRRLVRQDITVECELSADIWYFQANHLGQMKYSFKDYFRRRIGLNPTKAMGLSNIWEEFVKLGITGMKALCGRSWSKVKALLPGIKAKKITKRNVDEWLEYCTIGKEKSKQVEEIEKLIKNMIAKDAKEDMDDSLQKVVFSIPAYELETKDHFLEMAKNVLRTESDGNCWMTAAIDFSANHATAADAQIWKARGLIAMKETIERIYNGRIAVLFHPVDPTVIPEDLQGIIPVTKVFQAYAAQEGDDVRELSFVIASNKEEASKALGVKEVREFKVSIAPSYVPKPHPVFEEPEKKEEPAKKPKAGKKPKAEKAEEKPVDPVKWDDAKIQKIKKIATEEVKNVIRDLVKETGILRSDFDVKKDAFKKDPIDGLNVSQCLLYWLMEVQEHAGKT